MKRIVLAWVLTLAFTSCSQDQPKHAETPLKLPPKEKTWVKTEQVETTKEQVLMVNVSDKPKQEVAIDPKLKEKLLEPGEESAEIADKESCVAALSPIDKQRKLLQKQGGMWHAFERSPAIRPWSDIGFQIDAKFNMLVLALQHLCQSAKGLPLTDLAKRVQQMLDEKGVEKTRRAIVDWGRSPIDADIWIEYTRKAQESRSRTVKYSTIETLVGKARTMIDLYQTLYDIKADEENKDDYLTRSATLLDVINENLDDDEVLVMAIEEENAVPHLVFEGQM